MAQQKEALFSKRVARFLSDLPYTWHVRVPAFLAGLPDRIGCCNGQFFAFELKTSEKAPRSPLQKHIIQKMVDAGAYARFVYPENWEETQGHLQEFIWRTK